MLPHIQNTWNMKASTIPAIVVSAYLPRLLQTIYKDVYSSHYTAMLQEMAFLGTGGIFRKILTKLIVRFQVFSLKALLQQV